MSRVLSPALSGLYLHIPFCKRKCNYCDFYFTTSLNKTDAFIASLLEEIRLYEKQHDFGRFDTVYFGGGTPSVLGATAIEKILSALRRVFDITADAEITLEINPESAPVEFLHAIKHLGITRVSAGIQTLDDTLLKWMNRGHTSEQALSCLENIQKTGFQKWSLDLLHSIPGQTLSGYEDSLKTILSFNPPHLSAYSLTIEEGTPLHRQVDTGVIEPAAEDESLDQMRATHNQLSKAGFIHYELSNFAKTEYAQSWHNRKYWHGISYLGLGPSAHSFHDNRRWWNHRSLASYQEALKQGTYPIAEKETLTQDKKYMEAIMLGLRRHEGIGYQEIQKEFGINLKEQARDTLEDFASRSLVILHDDHFALTDEGFLLYNAIVKIVLDTTLSQLLP